MACLQNPISVEKLTGSTVQFALDLFKETTASQHGNAFLSPFSINVALAMTLAGARKATQTEMEKTLRLDEFSDTAELHSAFKDVIQSLLNKNNTGIDLHLGNRAYVHNELSVLPEFHGILTNHYQTSVAQVDFGKVEETRLQINNWVEKETREKIKNLIPKGVLEALTRLVLVNAIYFKGNWNKKFNAALTSKTDFHVDPLTVISVDMMRQKGKFPYSSSTELDCKALEMPYVGKSLSMILILPNKMDGLKSLEEKLNGDNLKSLMTGMREMDVEISLPKFRIEGEFSLRQHISKMGMPSLFSDSADLSGIAGSNDLYVAAVLHKAFLEVNEEGSEAAAATAVAINLRCMAITPEFNVNHPFLLMIRENSSGMILFMGRITNPQY